MEAVRLAVLLLPSRHSSSLRTVRAGMCLYVAMFVPYAVLQAMTLGKLAKLSDSSLDRDVALVCMRVARLWGQTVVTCGPPTGLDRNARQVVQTPKNQVRVWSVDGCEP